MREEIKGGNKKQPQSSKGQIHPGLSFLPLVCVCLGASHQPNLAVFVK